MQPLIFASLMVSVTSFGYHSEDNRVRSRPLSDLLDQQGTWNDGSFYPPVPDVSGWESDELFILMDYPGAFNRWLLENGHQGVGTMSYGTLTETDVDGGIEIEANFTTVNAIVHAQNVTDLEATWNGSHVNFPGPDNVYGVQTTQVLEGMTPALGTAVCYWKFTLNHSTPYATLPDWLYMRNGLKWQGFAPADFKFFYYSGTDETQKLVASIHMGTFWNATSGKYEEIDHFGSNFLTGYNANTC